MLRNSDCRAMRNTGSPASIHVHLHKRRCGQSRLASQASKNTQLQQPADARCQTPVRLVSSGNHAWNSRSTWLHAVSRNPISQPSRSIPQNFYTRARRATHPPKSHSHRDKADKERLECFAIGKLICWAHSAEWLLKARVAAAIYKSRRERLTLRCHLWPLREGILTTSSAW